ncbi:MAG TPA: exopolysaccharide biosynthesis polyprenyl glycosylphosphotransferase [Candidatus Omnitrophota bacterium]|nr:exopolysaccharide biosynthesis polyprenyl glycosylphosphotransferase [Candidatus Omnitrophota bacterium]HSA31937.1 exopolysaccharide biosynthesis polyprenyl glycosylphosphotransferase [Candidatus Omnitrophota bacterium]
MFRTRKKVKNFASLLILIIAGLFVTTTAWAAVTVMTADQEKNGVYHSEDRGVAGPSDGVKSRAPEPSTLALFASGLMGMIVSFVRKTYHVTKRILDIAAGVLGLVVLSPLFLLTAVLIKLTSKGPIFYTQVRVGKDGVPFKMYKFRTMRTDAEMGTGAVWAKENDDRIIPVGRFLRKAHIDEIPQFLNILKGDMSLIGPRPERPEFVKKLSLQIPDYEKRLRVKPGLTGLAQVWHRYDETLADVRKKVKYDLMYIKKVCLWTDLRIFFRTFRVVVTGEGAH